VTAILATAWLLVFIIKLLLLLYAGYISHC